ncbi:MAG: RluA family pseudouridine synthase [Salinisphaeraceae bacterium]|nr:RluA family pseudouridine synthase [Salinisphaeraceae bacterium]
MPQNFNQVRHLQISQDQAGQRVDNFLFRELKNVPKSHIYRLLRSGQVRLNGGRIKPTRKLQAGDELRIPPVRLPDSKAPRRVPDAGREEVLASIIHEDAGLLVLSKPSGWAVHGGTGVPYGIIEALRQARDDIDYLELAHRLDRETSGCLLLAKNRDMLTALHAGLRNDGNAAVHDKFYVCLVAGQWSGGERRVDLPLAAQQVEGEERMVKVDHDNGRPAESYFQLLEQFADCALMQVRITTGRMHQIRVHAQALGHPVLADRKYGDRRVNQQMRKYGLKRMFLHAARVRLKLENAPVQNKNLDFEAPLPAELETVLERLRHE